MINLPVVRPPEQLSAWTSSVSAPVRGSDRGGHAGAPAADDEHVRPRDDGRP